ncbi:MAG: DUF1707 domain-containing protein [Geodermatophilaceae bacterium]|nr:DUF1707 domain-containing protein [Geodermatophilaceae bacterium]
MLPAPADRFGPDDEPTDEERAAGVDILQRAVGEGRLTLGEFTDRVDVVLAASTNADLRAALADLPSNLPVVGSSSAPASFSIFGDIRVSGRWRLRERNQASPCSVTSASTSGTASVRKPKSPLKAAPSSRTWWSSSRRAWKPNWPVSRSSEIAA